MPEYINTDIVIKESKVSFSNSHDEPKGQLLLDYWHELRGERERPTWREFSFEDVIGLASAMIIKDVIDDGKEFRNRFWGTGNSAVVGFDGTGKTIAGYYEPEYVDEILTFFRAALHNPTPMVTVGKNYYQLKPAWRPYTSVCVGFTDENNAVSQLVIVYDE